MGKVKQKSMVMLVQVTMQTYVKGSRGSGKVIDGITYARRKVTAAKVMVKVAVNYRRSMIKNLNISNLSMEKGQYGVRASIESTVTQ